MSDSSWRAWIGCTSAPVTGAYPVSAASIGYLAEAVQDGLLLDAVRAGVLVEAPSPFVSVAARTPSWPLGEGTSNALMQALEIPLPTTATVNRRLEQQYHRSLGLGDMVTSRSTVMSVTPKRTRLGDGFFVTEEVAHTNQDGVLVAVTASTVYRYVPEGHANSSLSSSTQQQPGRRELVPDGRSPTTRPPYPVVELDVTLGTLVRAAGAVRDLTPIHHDVDAAQRSGHPVPFASWATQAAFIDRAVREWCGVGTTIGRLVLEMRAPVYMGRRLQCIAEKVGPTDGTGQYTRIDYRLATADGVRSIGAVEVETPAPEDVAKTAYHGC
jgi:acyl dehydratase